MTTKIKVRKKIYYNQAGMPLPLYVHAEYMQLLDNVDSPIADEIVSEVLLFLPLDSALRDLNRVDYRKISATALEQGYDIYTLFTGVLDDGSEVDMMSFADYIRLIICVKLSELDSMSNLLLTKELIQKVSEPTALKGFNLCNHLFNEISTEFKEPPNFSYHYMEQ